jgi:hypothetical protein
LPRPIIIPGSVDLLWIRIDFFTRIFQWGSEGRSLSESHHHAYNLVKSKYLVLYSAMLPESSSDDVNGDLFPSPIIIPKYLLDIKMFDIHWIPESSSEDVNGDLFLSPLILFVNLFVRSKCLGTINKCYQNLHLKMRIEIFFQVPSSFLGINWDIEIVKNHIHLIPESSSEDVNGELLSRILFIPKQFYF